MQQGVDSGDSRQTAARRAAHADFSAARARKEQRCLRAEAPRVAKRAAALTA